jgi:hypothetical protein
MGIYVIQLQGLPFVKIGKASSLKARIAAFDTGSPVPIITLAWWHPHHDASAETAAHHLWARLRVKGEWFHATADIVEWARWKGVSTEDEKEKQHHRTGERKARVLSMLQKRNTWHNKYPDGLISPRDLIIPSYPSLTTPIDPTP